MGARIIFVTGTDTGVGKTLLTGLLLASLRTRGIDALALKPFCSGDRSDVQLLAALQGHALSDAAINPFFFPEPVAPLASARQHHRSVKLSEVVNHIRGVARTCECLLVEGVGGLLVPLGEGFNVLDLLLRLECEVLVVSPNRLGTLNHTLLTTTVLRQALRAKRALSRSLKVVLMGVAQPEASSASNPGLLVELLNPVPLIQVPFLGKCCHVPKEIEKQAKSLQPALTRILKTRCVR